MENQSQLIVVESDVLPEVILKVLEVKKLLANKEEKSSASACKRIGVSRSAYYKYKDSVYLYTDRITSRVVTIYIILCDRVGVLSEVLSFFYKSRANILTINQNIPVDSTAPVTITVRFDDADSDPAAVCDDLKRVDGVTAAKIITGGSI